MIFKSSPVLLLLLPLALYEVYTFIRRHKKTLAFSSLDVIESLPKSKKQVFYHLPPLLRSLAVILLVFALARPQIEVQDIEENTKGIAIQLVVDVSSSMDMGIDFQGERTTRMALTRKVIEEFVMGNDDTLKGRPNDLIGVVTFSRFTETLSPLTLSHKTLSNMTNQLVHNQVVDEDGTAYGDGLKVAAAKLAMLDRLPDDSTSPGRNVASKIAILLTDGEDNCSKNQPLEAAAFARQNGIKVYTISLGDKPQTRKTNMDGNKIKIMEGASSTDQLLSRIAEETGGIFRSAHDFESLLSIYGEIDELETSEVTTSTFTDYVDIFYYFVAIAFVCILMEIVLSATYLRRLP